MRPRSHVVVRPTPIHAQEEGQEGQRRGEGDEPGVLLQRVRHELDGLLVHVVDAGEEAHEQKRGPEALEARAEGALEGAGEDRLHGPHEGGLVHVLPHRARLAQAVVQLLPRLPLPVHALRQRRVRCPQRLEVGVGPVEGRGQGPRGWEELGVAGLQGAGGQLALVDELQPQLRVPRELLPLLLGNPVVSE